MTDSQKWLMLVAVFATGWLLYLLAPVFTPFLIAALLAYLGDPAADKLESWKLSRTMAVIVVFLLMLVLLVLALLFLVPVLEKQIAYFINKIPEYVQWLQNTAIPWVSTRLGIEAVSVDLGSLSELANKYWKGAGGVAAQVLTSISTSGLALLGWVASIVLVPVVTFYLLRDWDILVARLRALIPRHLEKTAVQLVTESDEVLSSFMRGQFLVMISLGIIYSVGLWIVGLQLGLLIGMLAGLVSFVPYLGFIVGVLAAGIAILVQTHDVMQLLPIVIVFGVGQALESVLLTPLLVGDRIGLHPVVVIFAVLAGGQLFGFFGILLALPVAAVIAVLIRHAHKRYVNSHIYDQANR